MKKMKMRGLCLLFAALLCSVAVVGCKKTNEQGSGDTTQDTQKTKEYVILQGEPSTSYNFGDEEYAIAFRKGDVDLCRAVQAALDEILADGTAAKISTEWFGSDVLLRDNEYASDADAAGGDGSFAYVQQKGTLIIGLDNEYPPMGFLDDNGELTGIDIALAKAIEGKLGVKVVFQPITWSAKDTELKTKNIDCIWNGLSVNEDRKEAYTLSKPYLANAQIVLTANDSGIATIADLEGKRVGTQDGSAALEAMTQSGYTEKFSDLQTYETFYAAYLDLKAARIDALVGDKTFIEYILSAQTEQ